MTKVNEVFVVLTEFFNNFLVPFQLPGFVLHGVKNEDTVWDVVVLVGSEPVGENGVGGAVVRFGKFVDFNSGVF